MHVVTDDVVYVYVYMCIIFTVRYRMLCISLTKV